MAPIEAKVDKTGTHNPQKAIAQKMVDLVKAGKTPEQAARRMGVSLTRNEKLRKAMAELMVEAGGVPPHVQRELVRAARLKTMVDFADSPDETKRSLSLRAARDIGSDPDVGLNQPPQIQVTVDMGRLEEVFKHLNVNDLENIPDAEFEEISNDES
jgi:hypothetical protein